MNQIRDGRADPLISFSHCMYFSVFGLRWIGLDYVDSCQSIPRLHDLIVGLAQIGDE